MDSIVVSPAYGRDYKSRAEVIAAWESGVDFILRPQGCYCSIRDFFPGTDVDLRYDKLTKVTIYYMR